MFGSIIIIKIMIKKSLRFRNTMDTASTDSSHLYYFKLENKEDKRVK